jgi:predicted AAA+ superfamily ATPase
MAEPLNKTIAESPIVYLNGPRQTGKSWLTQNLTLGQDINYITFDSPLVLASAKADPERFIKSLPTDKLSVIDEVQLAPEVFRLLKISVDQNRTKGRDSGLYLLTGSANLMALPSLSDALVGRMSVLTLLPISSGEYKQTCFNFIDRLFNENLGYRKYADYDLLDVITHSTFPGQVVSPRNPTRWCDDYLNTIIQRDVKSIADIRKPEKLIMLLSFLALRAGGLLNNSGLAQEAGLAMATYEGYKRFLINTFIVAEIQPWAKPGRLNKRFTKSVKLFFNDTNLLVYLLRRDIYDIFKNDEPAAGHIFENFIATEIMKNATSLIDIDVSHFRTSDGKEVDFVVEKHNGDTIGIEVKLDMTIKQEDFKGLKVLKEAVGNKFVKGVVIYTGNEIGTFGEDMWAVPVCYLWAR